MMEGFGRDWANNEQKAQNSFCGKPHRDRERRLSKGYNAVERSVVKEKVVESSTASDTVEADVNEEPGTTRVTL